MKQSQHFCTMLSLLYVKSNRTQNELLLHPGNNYNPTSYDALLAAMWMLTYVDLNLCESLYEECVNIML